jgi:DNA-binding HxlR family transcriptional regulator
MAMRRQPDIAPSIYYDPALCPVRSVLAQIGDKWSLLVFCHLGFGRHRFSELLGALPDISQRMLTQTLRKLEREGFVKRTVTPTTPPRVDYELTELGVSLIEPLSALADWATRSRAQVERARTRYDARQTVRTAISAK